MEHKSLDGKTVVITGGSGILCREFAYALARQRMNVAVIGRTLSKLQEVTDKVNELGGKGLAVTADVTDPEAVKAAKEKINSEFGSVDILINGAGGNHPRGTTSKEYFEAGDIEDPDVVSFFDLKPENFSYVFDLNIVGTVVPTQIFLPDMIGREGVSVINVASMSSYKAITRVSAYSAAKAAIVNFTEWLAVHFANSGVRVNAIAPGWFETAQNQALLHNPDGSLSNRAKKVIAHTPYGRFGRPEELTGTILYLADAEMSGFVTGATIPVDGGFNAYCGV